MLLPFRPGGHKAWSISESATGYTLKCTQTYNKNGSEGYCRPINGLPYPAHSCLILHNPTLSCTILSYPAQSTILYNSALSCTVHNSALSCTVLSILYKPALFCTFLPYRAQSCLILHNPSSSCTILPYPVQSCLILHNPASSCTILPYQS